MRRIYLDHNATTPLDPAALAAMLPWLGAPANASSLHREGQRARAAVEAARRQVAALLGAHATEILFTSGATEANNLAIATLAARTPGALLTTAVEHPSVLAPLALLEARGRAVHRLPVDARGQLPSPTEIIAFAEAHHVTALSLMLANNETGNRYPVAEIAREARARGWLIHTDATQAPGKIPFQIKDLHVGLLSISAHKLYGPTGAGALWVRGGLELSPLQVGGHQERGRRGGTEGVAALAGFGAAAALAAARQPEDAARMAALRDRLWAGIAALEPAAACQTALEAALPNTLNVRFAGVDGESLLINLDLEGIAASAGSACSAGSLEPSPVILAMGVAPAAARGSVRFSLGRHTTQDEIDAVLALLPALLRRARQDRW
jgi:cysteine desulfurase